MFVQQSYLLLNNIKAISELKRAIMWKTLLFILFLFGFNDYTYGDEKLDADVAKTYQNLLTKSRFEDRVSLVDVFVQRASERREAVIKQRERTNSDLLVLLHINILRGFHNEMDTSSSSNCTKSLDNLKITLYPNRIQTIMFAFEQSI